MFEFFHRNYLALFAVFDTFDGDGDGLAIAVGSKDFSVEFEGKTLLIKDLTKLFAYFHVDAHATDVA